MARPYRRSPETITQMNAAAMLYALWGMSIRAIAVLLGRKWDTVGAWLSPTLQEIRCVRSREAYVYKRDNGLLVKPDLVRKKLRVQARLEADATGVPVEELYVRWGCA